MMSRGRRLNDTALIRFLVEHSNAERSEVGDVALEVHWPLTSTVRFGMDSDWKSQSPTRIDARDITIPQHSYRAIPVAVRDKLPDDRDYLFEVDHASEDVDAFNSSDGAITLRRRTRVGKLHETEFPMACYVHSEAGTSADGKVRSEATTERRSPAIKATSFPEHDYAVPELSCMAAAVMLAACGR
ncbi:hypothetical protein N7532_000088 [Penicillium argentinense]|uniref:Uncharacterized protein n=1 Tax=Penicillium argentinense TaxID=1131581 RepID=A0A9W9G4Q9_9EURO|nr:uncharacterized protein N7532_000088 [Penicillium argentinense]KAJ5112043.1 hypothetical protein N7532_000088 [Penicillium argentinense]